MELLKKLEGKKDDTNFLQKFEETKLNGKRKLASFIHSKTGILVDPSSLFDVQVKSSASDEDVQNVKQLTDERCPAIWAMQNPVPFTTSAVKTN